MSGLRVFPDVSAGVALPVERQRAIGWSLLSGVAEQQLRRGASVVLDLVAREEPRRDWERLAIEYEASFSVVECVCSDPVVLRARVEGRSRSIPGWYELTWADVERSRANYLPLAAPKVVIDAVTPVGENLAHVRDHLGVGKSECTTDPCGDKLRRTRGASDAISAARYSTEALLRGDAVRMQVQRDERPWGSYEVLLDAPDHKVKRICVKPGTRLSYQVHARRSEHWFIVRGAGNVTLDGVASHVTPGCAVDAPVGTAHRIQNVRK